MSNDGWSGHESVISVPKDLVPARRAMLLPPAYDQDVFKAPFFRATVEPYPRFNDDVYVRVSELVAQPLRVMSAAYSIFGSDVVPSKELVCCAYALGVASCTWQEIAVMLPDMPGIEISRQLNKLRYYIALDNQIAISQLKNTHRRRTECAECNRVIRQYLEHKAPRGQQLYDFLRRLQ